MALHSEFRIPGAFHTDTIHAGIFRRPDPSPSSPSASGYLSARSTDDHPYNSKRKRFHDDSARSHSNVTQYDFNPPSTPAKHQAARPYVLAGQLDTPGVAAAAADDGGDAMGDSMFSDSDYRRMLGTNTKRTRDDIDDPDQIFFGAGVQQLSQQSSSSSQSWGSFAATALGGVVGRIWQFCRAGSFKGFHAGGGEGYDLEPSIDDVSMLQDDEMDQRQNIPGRFPHAADWSGRYNELAQLDSRSSSPSAPAPKRRQTAAAPADDLGKNWVMVQDPDGSRAGTPEARQSTPRNRNQAPAVTTGRRISTPAARRRSTASRPSTASTPTVGTAPQPVSSASYASPRSPSPTKTINTPTAPVSVPKTHSARRHRASAGVVASPSHRRSNSGASVASGRVSQADGGNANGSPRLDNEARKLAARRKRDEQYADVRMSAFSKTVQDMIRQGQEALATTVEVEGDRGWEDDDY